MYFVANSSRVQTFIAKRATEILSSTLGTEVNIERAEFRFFTKIVLHNVLVRDMEQDTLLYTKELKARINFIDPIENRYYLADLHLDELKLHFKKRAGEKDYNYAFLTLGSKDKKKQNSEVPDFRLGVFSINDLEFLDYNAEKRQQLKFNSKYTSVSSKKIDLQNNLIHIDALVMEKGVFDLIKFGIQDSSTTDSVLSTSTVWNPKEWDIRIGHTMLSNSTFHYQKTGYSSDREGIDYNNILVEQIDMDLVNTYLDCDSIKSRIENLSAKEQSGFIIEKLQSDATIAPNKMVFENLKLITPNSSINDYYAMHYNSLGDFKDYVNNVRMEGNFNNAKIAVEDINYFAKALDKIDHNTLFLTGKITGSVSKLRGKKLNLRFAPESFFEGNISLTGLPNFQETFIQLDINKSEGNFDDIYQFYPSMNPAVKRLANLGDISFRGEFVGFPKDFVAEGFIISDIGFIESDINLKLRDDDKNSSYSGKLKASDFNLGKWLNQEEQFGQISFSAEVKGKGLKLDNMDAKLKGEIEELGILDYNYNNINVDGSLQKRLFEGKLTAQDPNLKLAFDGLVNFKEKTPKLSFKASVESANLQALKLTEQNYVFGTELKLDITGIDIDDFNGSGSIYNTKIYTETDSFNLDSLQLTAKQMDEQSRHIGIKSDLVDANFNGYFSFRELPKALKDFARFYLVKYSKEEEKEQYINQSEQLFTFDVKIKDSKNFTSLFWPAFKNVRNGNINGRFSSYNNTLIVNSEIENILLYNSDLRNFKLKTTSSSNKFQISTSIDSLLRRDSLISESIILNTDLKEDSIQFNLGIQSTDNPNHLVLNGNFQSDLKSLKGGFNNSEIMLLNQPWTIDEHNLIEFKEGYLNISNLQLSNKDHLLKINTELMEDSVVNLNASLENFPLNEISDILQKVTRYRFQGIANGRVEVQDLFGKRQLQSSLDIQTLQINEYPIGDLKTRITYGHNSELVNIDGSLDGDGSDVILSGHYNLASVKDKLNLIFRIRKFNLENTSPFLENIVTRPTGNISGNIFVYGPLEKPILSGKLKGEDVAAKVNYLNVRYNIPNISADLSDDRISFDNFIVYDEDKNIAHGKGKIRHDYLKNFFLDFNISTDRFKFLNTKSNQNQSFYGAAYGQGYVMIAGDLKNIDFYINATTLKETNLSVSVSETKEVEQYSFYRFVNNKEDKKKPKKDFVAKRSPISVNMDLDITETADLNLILDYEEGDIIQGNGNGKVKITLDNYNDLNIAGKYEITQGDYLFSLQNLISKKFKMESGSSITWLGDPSDAALDIKAVYKLRTSPYDLIEDAVVADTDLESAARSRVPTYLYLLIGGTLEDPRINFDIKVPDADQAIKSTLDSKLQLVKLDPNELNKQVVALLVLNRFVPVYPLGSNTNNTVLEGVNNTVSEFLSNQLSLYLSDWISQFITEVQLDINFRNYQTELSDNGTGGTLPGEDEFQNRRELQLALTKSFLNNRLTIDIGGNFDFGQENQNASTQNNTDATNVTGDFEIQYGLTKDNRLRLKAFRKSEYDIFNERNRNKTGLGIIYRREFDNVKDLLKFIRRKRESKQEKQEQIESDK